MADFMCMCSVIIINIRTQSMQQNDDKDDDLLIVVYNVAGTG